MAAFTSLRYDELIYQHISEQRDKEIAAGLDEQIAKERDRARNGHGETRHRRA